MLTPKREFEDYIDNRINEVNAAGTLVPTIGQISPNNTNTFSAAGPSNAASSPTHGKFSFIDASQLPDDPDMPQLENITYSDDGDDVGAEADFNNLETSITVSPIPTTRVHKDHPVTQIIGDLSSATQTRSMTRVAKDQGGLSQMLNDDFHTYAAFDGKEPHFDTKKPESEVIVSPSKFEDYIDNSINEVNAAATQTRSMTRVAKDQCGLSQMLNDDFHTLERIKAIRLFLAYASFMGFMVYQVDVKSAFLYGTIKEEIYVCQPPGFEDPDHPDKVYKVVKALYDLHQAHRAWYETLANYLLENGFQR
nr:hypothetical protein [Tanacetum cinerariifolium]